MTDMAQRAAELYHEGAADTIVLTGYRSAADGMQDSEASLLKRVLIADGVPDAAISLDDEAANTGQNIMHAVRMLRADGRAIESVILVHKPFMTRRFLATAEAPWPEPKPIFLLSLLTRRFVIISVCITKPILTTRSGLSARCLVNMGGSRSILHEDFRVSSRIQPQPNMPMSICSQPDFRCAKLGCRKNPKSCKITDVTHKPRFA